MTSFALNVGRIFEAQNKRWGEGRKAVLATYSLKYMDVRN